MNTDSGNTETTFSQYFAIFILCEVLLNLLVVILAAIIVNVIEEGPIDPIVGFFQFPIMIGSIYLTFYFTRSNKEDVTEITGPLPQTDSPEHDKDTVAKKDNEKNARDYALGKRLLKVGHGFLILSIISINTLGKSLGDGLIILPLFLITLFLYLAGVRYLSVGKKSK